jgi:hypothetical protein
VRLGERLARQRDQPARERARRGERDLLAEHGPHRELAAVDGARHPQPRASGHERAEERVAREMGVGGGRVGTREPVNRALGRGTVA